MFQNIFVLKISLKSFVLTSIFILTFLAHAQQDSGEKSEDLKYLDIKQVSQELDQIIAMQFKNLDQLDSQLQFLFQALNRGSLDKFFFSKNSKEKVSNFLVHNQKSIETIKNKFISMPSNNLLIYIAESTEKLATNIYDLLKNNFRKFKIVNLQEFLPNLPNQLDKFNFKQLDNYNASNLYIISLINKKMENIDLTSLNLLIRKIDNFNSRYQITGKLEQLPFWAFLGSTIVYFTPNKYFSFNSALIKLKKKIGSSKKDILPIPENSASSNNIEFDNNKETASSNDANLIKSYREGIYGSLMNLGKDEEFQFLYQIFTTTAILALGKNSDLKNMPVLGALKPLFHTVKNKLSSSWSALKGFKNLKHNRKEYIEFTLDDERLIGIEPQVKELRKIIDYIVNPEVYDRSNNSVEKGVLLTGPTRCGKTFAARALSGSINQKLKEINSDIKFKFMEVDLRKLFYSDGVKELFREAKESAPCILFIDEIHLLPLQSKESFSLLSQLLTSMSGLTSERDNTKQVILLAATNHPELMDSALLQPGRFGTIIHFEKPSYDNRKKYFNMIFKTNYINQDCFDLDLLARLTNNCSYGDLDKIVKDARFESQALYSTINQEKILKTIFSFLYKIREELPSNLAEREILSIYYAGKALLIFLLQEAGTNFKDLQLELVTINQIDPTIKETNLLKEAFDSQKQNNLMNFSKKYGKLVIYNKLENLNLNSTEYKINKCKLKLAGNIAEKLLLNKITKNSKNKEKAYTIAKEIIFDGLKEENISTGIRDNLLEQTYNVVSEYELEIENLFKKNLDLLAAIAKKLETYGILTNAEITNIVANYKKI